MKKSTSVGYKMFWMITLTIFSLINSGIFFFITLIAVEATAYPTGAFFAFFGSISFFLFVKSAEIAYHLANVYLAILTEEADQK